MARTLFIKWLNYLYSLNQFGWYTTNNSIGFYIFRHNCTCGNDGAVTNGHSSKYRSVSPYPDVLPYMYRGIVHTLSFLWVQVMVECCKNDVMPNQGSFVDEDAALVLELATHIDEHPFRKHGVLSAIRMEWREHTNGLGNFPAK